MTHENAVRGVQRRAFIEGLLTRYPLVDSNELNDLKRWFGKEATALDVGLIASDPSLAKPYRRFAEEHIDPLTTKDILYVAAAAVLAALGFAAILIFAI